MQIETYIERLEKALITRSVAGQIRELRAKYLEEYDAVAIPILKALEDMGYDPVAVTDRYTIDYLMELDHFLRNGDYGHDDYEAIRASIYDDKEVMMETYMPGLLIAYICMSVLYAKFHFYNIDFLPRVKSGGKGLEVGFGDGFYLWNLHRAHPEIKLAGYDISDHAKTFATKFFRAAGISDEAFDLRFGDIREGLSETDGSADWFILAEVIEHLPDPSQGFREMHRVLKPGGVFYLSTVIDSNHMDHIVNFKDVSEIEKLFAENGLAVEARLRYKVDEEVPQSRDPSVGLAFVGRRR